ncbi:helicase associated domain-containing protein [Streptomyces mirabilis]|uniref:Helicase associated domain-containing protein n=1 Tax=Streptomyces mirabilis TaxID=68239 RepID=A0ABU3V6Y2_9ACTN|nr:helicase associated domain-containing protein [Streptomyces mirabilis]MCX4617670.1 helicase associated domain-containing protein [Streptomyces mirabilis]MCX5356833.1 helicase associated domain-containing protein [Streptomyces mirabilis]MDU9001947.1 helicase associated domain-containing protein [Streptomyces mirabilis]
MAGALAWFIDPEGAYWRRGIEAATRWLRETGKTELRVRYVFVVPDEWGAVGGYPLGRWIADLRRYHAAGSSVWRGAARTGGRGDRAG